MGDFFRADAIVGVSPANDVTVDAVDFVSPTQLEVSITVDSSATPGPRRVSVLVPGPGPGINDRAGSSDHCQCLTVS